MFVELIGYLGGIFIMISFIPQVIKCHKTKSVKDLSILMLITTFIGTIFWTIYGFLINGMSIVVMNVIFGILVLYQIYLKIRYEK